MPDGFIKLLIILSELLTSTYDGARGKNNQMGAANYSTAHNVNMSKFRFRVCGHKLHSNINGKGKNKNYVTIIA